MGDAFAGLTEHIAIEYGSVVVNGIPLSCMAQIEAYNAHPNTTDLNAMHDTTIPINDTAIYITGAPDYVTTYPHILRSDNPSSGTIK